MSYGNARARTQQATALPIAAPQFASMPPPAPPASPQDVARLRSILGRLRFDNSPRAWAIRLRDAEQRGERLTMAQRDAWRRALGAALADAE
jgi:hypothetical protein